MKIMIAAVFYFLYGGVCFLGTGTDRKNPALPFCSVIFSCLQSCFPFWRGIPLFAAAAALAALIVTVL